MTNDIKQKVLDAIHERGITPLPRWHFVLKQMLLWAGLVTSCVIASFLVALLVFQIGNYGMLPPRLAPLFTGFTIISSLIFIALATYQVKQTKNAYRTEGWKFLAGILVLSFILGVVFFSVRLHERFEQVIPGGARFLGGVTTIENFWVDPDDGLLAGRVIWYEDGSKILELRGFDEEDYTVSIEEVRGQDLMILDTYDEVRLVGYLEDEARFHACAMAPWRLAGGPIRPALDRRWTPPRQTDQNNGRPTKPTPSDLFKQFIETTSSIVRSNQCQ
ncbi:hypothetical protein KC929_02415 [Patescibacteria group bacterium]|nr:hypothetical protein [Patescibacteria group bacterium]